MNALSAARQALRAALPALLLVAGGVSCDLVPTAKQGQGPATVGQDLRLTLLHTSDIHSRLLPYEFDPSFTDVGLGLSPDAQSYGGMARIAYILKRERAQAGRVLHLDSGDCFQGAIIFNVFQGEAEVASMTESGLDAAVIGNHEFDNGAHNLATQAAARAGYDLLAANYDFENSDLPWATELERITLPSTIYHLDGLSVGVIGLANLSSLNSIHDEDNSLGVRVLDEYDLVPEASRLLRNQGADIVISLSHMGLDDDIEQARTMPPIEVDGELRAPVDVILGGHHHVAIDPPLVVTNEHTGQRIPVVHSGAFAKFLGRLDLVIRDGHVLSHDYELFAISSIDSPDEDAAVSELLEPYEQELERTYRTDQVIAYANERLLRYGSTGGDSMLGNFAAEAMRDYPGVETDIAITNTLGIRADIAEGEITLDELYNSMPFDNTITTMFLSGREVQELLDYVSFRSSERGCNSQAQVAGIEFTMNCRDFVAEDIRINGEPLILDSSYELATNNYIAFGGSGFYMLERNTTQSPTDISIRDVVRAAMTSYYELPQPGVCQEDGRILPEF
ncbi:MAG: bifunctional metallophosphatase/5'-nucleotidase [Alphaproteobacteria bacterium]|nr:bifunctional metallophosphatase/5'-nucleotidase [Alphaproteobacteria bacterium]MCB9794414.1 bifunctional metallophosphatase/5'-nucleotidase [Alphaproteobacteria bacterium]